MNEFIEEDDQEVEILEVSDEATVTQARRLGAMREQRDGERVQRCLETLKEAAQGDKNVIPSMLDCARAYCTLFEIRSVLEEVYGAYREPVFF